MAGMILATYQFWQSTSKYHATKVAVMIVIMAVKRKVFVHLK